MQQTKINLTKLAKILQAYINCSQSNNVIWQEKHKETIMDMLKLLPSGSGMDNGGTKFDWDKSTPAKLVFYFDYHHMKDGSYTGWTSYSVIVTPSFGSFDLNIKGRNIDDIKDYFYDMFDDLFCAPEDLPLPTKSIAISAGLPKEIKGTNDIKQFFGHLMAVEGLNFHPDTPFSDYIFTDDSKVNFPAYTPAEAAVRQNLMNDCFNLCHVTGTDIYDIAMQVSTAFDLVQHIRFSRTKKFQHDGQSFAGIRPYVDEQFADTENNSLAVYYKDSDELMRQVLQLDAM